MKKIITISILLLILTSCSWSKVEPNFKQSGETNYTSDQKLEDITYKDNVEDVWKDINIDSNLSVLQEIEDRQKWFDKLNTSKEYLEEVKLKLDKNLENFNTYIEVTRQLLLADLKIINSVQKWILKESAISKNNYYYNFLKWLNKDQRNIYLSNIENIIKVVEEKKLFNRYYFVNLDIDKLDSIDDTSKEVFIYINYYLKNAKYNWDFIKNIDFILNNFEILKIVNIDVINWKSMFKWISNVKLYESTLKNLKNILSK